MKDGQITSQFAQKILDSMADIQAKGRQIASENPNVKPEGKTFTQHLKDGVQQVSEQHSLAEKMATDLSTGKTGNIHETMLATTQAELSFNLMVQVRNKALEAYTEIMRMPV